MACLGLAVVSWVSGEACENTLKPVVPLSTQPLCNIVRLHVEGLYLGLHVDGPSSPPVEF